MSAVFLDTVGLLALWDRSDQWHTDAEIAWEQLKNRKRSVLTTSFILLECGNAAARRPYRQVVNLLRNQLDAGGALIHPTEADWSQAWEAYRNDENAGAGIVDQVSFCVMRRLKLTEAFTNDRHFVAAGFAILF
jgi:hypothetical protein